MEARSTIHSQQVGTPPDCARATAVLRRGGSAFRAMAGFGRHHLLHEAHFFELAGTLTVEIEFIVTDAESHQLLELLTSALRRDQPRGRRPSQWRCQSVGNRGIAVLAGVFADSSAGTAAKSWCTARKECVACCAALPDHERRKLWTASNRIQRELSAKYGSRDCTATNVVGLCWRSRDVQTEQLTWNADGGWQSRARALHDAHLVLYFGSSDALVSQDWYRDLRARYPDACIVGCTSGGQIQQDGISETGIAAVAVRFMTTQLRVATESGVQSSQSHEYGVALGRELSADGLAGVLVLSDGLNVNGSELVRGLRSTLGSAVHVSGGLAGDGARFAQTRVGANTLPQPATIAAIGFYGSAVRFSCGCSGGWDTFGVARRVTRSAGNELFELDGKPALDLYERYLGEEADGLPGTALLYPLKIWDPESPLHDVVRTVLAVNRQARSMIFAGDIPQGCKAQLMRGEFTALAAGATEAASQAAAKHSGCGARGGLALLVSCIGRRLLMGQRIDDEIQAVREVLPADVAQLGFYSYGEIAPHAASGVCELHNQTMTITLISELVT
jgi:hypothetical protein